MLLEVDARDRRAAARARDAELVVHAVGLRRRSRPRARSSRPRASSSWIAAASRSVSAASTWVESEYGESCAAQRISLAHARPIPAISRWSRSSECSRRESEREDARDVLGRQAVRLGAEVRELRLQRVRVEQPARPRASSSRPPSAAARRRRRSARRNIGVFAPLPFGAHVLQPTRAHQVHHHDELSVVGREEEALRAALDALEAARRRAPRAAARTSSASRCAPGRPSRSASA